MKNRLWLMGGAVTVLLTVLLSTGGAVPRQPDLDTVPCRWEPVGPGGGGGMFYPSFSPSDGGKFMTLACDMGGYYRSTNHGETWQMMEFGLHGRPGGPIGYDPTNAQLLFAVKFRNLWKSSDAGLTWKPAAMVTGVGNDDFVVDPQNPRRVWVAMTTQTVHPIFESSDRGDTWKPGGRGIPDRTEVRGLHLDLSSPTDRRRLFAATSAGFYVSADNGGSWVRGAALAGEKFLDMVGYSSPKTSAVLFAAVKGKGVYRSDNGGAHWEIAGAGLPGNGATCKLLAMPRTGSSLVYAVCGVGEIYRTDNSGGSWRRIHDATKDMVAECWVSSELGPGWAGNIQGLAVNPANPNEVVFTDFMRACRSRDGGRSWHALHTRRNGSAWTTTGLDVTTTYGITFDPHNPDRRYMTCGDVGLLGSADSGKSWRRLVTGVPPTWVNSCYEVAVDPAEPSRIWGAFSRLHDLPHVLGNLSGGICASRDGGEKWAACKGLPNLPATAVILDPRSTPASRTLYAGLYTGGVFRSTDGGRSWTEKSRGLPPAPAVWRLALHRDGTLLCAVARYRKTAGGLYISTDGAESWRRLENDAAFAAPLDAAFDPRSSRIIYATSSTGAPPSAGGLYRSADGGATWRQLLGDRHIWGVTLDPANPNVIYACSMALGGGRSRSILYSRDGGASWKCLTGIPFNNLHRVIIDPRDSRTLFVTTFGAGVWKTTLPKG